MNEQRLRWNDLEVVLAVARAGSLSGASRHLQVSHATVFRRLQQLEQRLGVQLFERHRQGYVTTAAGEDLAATATRVEAEVHATERRLAGQDDKPGGTIRLTTTDTLFAGLVSPLLADFRRRYPDTTLEVVLSNQQQSLSKREADIALRPTPAPPETLVGRRVEFITQAVYGAKAHWQTCASLAEDTLSTQSWIGPDVHLGDPVLETWMKDKPTRYRLDSLLGIQLALHHDADVGVLPCYLGDADTALVRLTPPIEVLATPLWLLTHPDLSHLARVRAFMEAMTEGIRQRMAGST
ncbi:LysR family transcriptional regulator [Halomonas sp. HNIBRBA4712]|uniref:LysR family transcriptional regulator n=1 Tax=Halomonas sp. HNIBRBA4712 TaxID=3373087 RepID=UPI0037475326